MKTNIEATSAAQINSLQDIDNKLAAILSQRSDEVTSLIDKLEGVASNVTSNVNNLKSTLQNAADQSNTWVDKFKQQCTEQRVSCLLQEKNK